MSNSWDAKALSDAAAIIWGKTKRDTDAWIPLWRHLADAGPVAGRLWDNWVPERVQHLIAASLPRGHEDARKLLVWLAGVHDIGKATPSFTRQVPWLADSGNRFGLYWSPARERYPDCAHHTVTGQLILEHWLDDQYGWPRRRSRQLGCVVGGHHGSPPTSAMLTEIAESTRQAAMGWRPGGPAAKPWRMVQWELLSWVAESSGVDERLADWSDVRFSQQVQVLLTAIVIMADWIASNEDYFPFQSADSVDDGGRIDTGWRRVSLPPRWQPTSLPDDVSQFYRSRFVDRPARPLQVAAVEVARKQTGPSIMVIEAPMGEGKTEAALLAAEVVSERGGGGVVFALPTRATSDAVLSRIVPWLRNVAGGKGSALDLGLGHGKSRFNPEFQRLLRDGYTCIDADWKPPNHDRGSRAPRHKGVPSVAAHRWLAGRKRVLLSQFAVVTIDQVLMAALKAKHVVLRHLGLAGKTVILDEAHAYDVFMSQYLHQVVRWLASYGCSVIVLSATLPATKRAALIAAYQGRPLPDRLVSEKYPAIVSAGLVGPAEVTSCQSDASRDCDVTVERLDETGDTSPCAALIEELAWSLRDGGCALVIRNTVSRAARTAEALAKHFEDAVSVRLVHSRFIAADRERNDNWLRTEFGADRPGTVEPVIVVATQVAEQSLDIDFDLLVSDLAPVDLLLQRMGRIHRHLRGTGQRERPGRLRSARCLIGGADWGGQPPAPVKASTYVYHPYPMLRAAAVLADHGDGESCRVSLPGDISPLVQRAYGDGPVGPVEWRDAIHEEFAHFGAAQARREAEALRFRLADPAQAGKSLVGWLSAGVGDVDEEAGGRGQVRDGQDTIEVLLLIERDGRWFLPDWLDEHGGTEVPREAEPSTAIAKAVLGCTVSLPYWLNPDEVISELKNRCDLSAWQMSHWLAGELVLAVDAETLSTTVVNVLVSYHPELGLTAARTTVRGA